MQVLIRSLIASSLLIYSLTSFSAQNGSNQSQLLTKNIQSDIHQLKQDVKTTTNDIEILRRDQINYLIEKDILKDAYTTSIQTINTVITFVLGVFGILGYLGFRSIKEVKSDYTNELIELKAVKAKFESELNSLVDQQRVFENRIGELDIANERQDRRLKVLELIEKISVYMRSNQWQWALEYISLGLDIDKDNVILLNQKTVCHGRLGDFSSAIGSCKKVIELLQEPTEKLAATINLLEFLALNNQPIEFANIYTTNKTVIDQHNNGNTSAYMNALNLLINGDFQQAVDGLDTFAKINPQNEPIKYLDSWGFDEALLVTSRLPAGKQKDLLIEMIKFFNGEISSNDFVTYLTPL